MAWELVTFKQLKEYLTLEKSLITDYPALGVIKESVEFAIEDYLGRDLEQMARTESFYITGPTDIISLRGLPMVSVSSLIVTLQDETETLDSDSYTMTKYGLLLYRQYQNAKIDITYTGGETAVPNNINRGALIQTAFEYQSKDQIGAEALSTEGGTVSRPALGLLSEVKRRLNRSMHPLKITG